MPTPRIAEPTVSGTEPPRRGAPYRLMDAMVTVAAAEGYRGVTVAKLIAEAGTARQTFYDHFDSVEACYLAAYRVHARRLSRAVQQAVAESDEPAHAALAALFEVAGQTPAVANLLMTEALVAGHAAFEERDRLIGEIEATIARAGGTYVVDLPPQVLGGAAFRELSMHMTAGGLDRELLDSLSAWTSSFARPWGRTRWSDRLSTLHSPVPAAAPCAVEAAETTTREKLLRATAQIVAAEGYAAMTIGDIVAAAGTSRATFYLYFADKREAFEATRSHGFEQTMAASVTGFFQGDTWPERIWRSGVAFMEYFSHEPDVARLAFVELYGAGGDTVAGSNASLRAFEILFEEGYRQRPEPPPPLWSEITLSALMELCFQLVWRDSIHDLVRRLPVGIYIAVAPFIGSDTAGHFVDERLRSMAAAA